MPLTFLEIERQKSWRIALLFSVLLFLYFCVALSLVLGLGWLSGIPFVKGDLFWFFKSPLLLGTIIAVSLLFAGMHFWFSAYGAAGSVMRSVGAVMPDKEDGMHRRLLNVMDEIHIATGNKRRMQCKVIPSLSMNALAVDDLKGEAVIGITEGLLSKLSRPQLESVMAHEAYHILSGDCMETTVATSLFGMYASAFESMEQWDDERARGLHPAFLLCWVLLTLSKMLCMFISREREYRADAASVRMTRNPLSLAEALLILSRQWTGTGVISTGVEMLCITSPQPSARDEEEGWLADLMSTHPPVSKRIGILVRMAHKSLASFLAQEEGGKKSARLIPTEPHFYVRGPEQTWQGPFVLSDLAGLSWLSPATWISEGRESAVERASENSTVRALFLNHPRASGERHGVYTCLSCRQPLVETAYEKTRVYRCEFCQGVLVENDKIPRIIARTEEGCTDRIKSLAQAVARDNQKMMTIKRLKGIAGDTVPLSRCSKCKNPMLRTFYSLAYPIEIDRCNTCGTTWFQKDELEMLQCLIENKTPVRMEG